MVAGKSRYEEDAEDVKVEVKVEDEAQVDGSAKKARKERVK